MAVPARSIHRWLSTICAIFLAWIAITGSLLALDELTKPGAANTDAAYTLMRNQLHFFLKDLHSGAIVGLPGQALDALTGFALVTLAVTGLTVYLKLLRARRKSGRQGLFWRTPVQTGAPTQGSHRQFHRWAATIGGIFLFYVATTGTALQIDELAGGKPPPVATVNGAPVLPPGMKIPFWGVLQEFHSMAVAGTPGECLDLVTGLLFTVLAITGIVVYLRMFSARRHSGRSGMLWK